MSFLFIKIQSTITAVLVGLFDVSTVTQQLVKVKYRYFSCFECFICACERVRIFINIFISNICKNMYQKVFAMHITHLKIDEKTVIRNQYNIIPQLAQDTKPERNTKTKYKTTQAESQEDSYFPEDCHWAICNKRNKQSKANGRLLINDY